MELEGHMGQRAVIADGDTHAAEPCERDRSRRDFPARNREEDHADDGEMNGMHAYFRRQRREDGADDDDRRYRVDETANEQECSGGDKAYTGHAAAPARDRGDDELWDVEVGEKPPERRCSADAKQGDGREARRVVESVPQSLERYRAVDDATQQCCIEHGDDRGLGGRK